MRTICINRSGRTLPVTRVNGGSDVIGCLNLNDVFTLTHGWTGNHTGADYQGDYYITSSGTPVTGWLNEATHLGGLTPFIN